MVDIDITMACDISIYCVFSQLNRWDRPAAARGCACVTKNHNHEPWHVTYFLGVFFLTKIIRIQEYDLCFCLRNKALR